MPLILRSIEPINVARGVIPSEMPSELECCTSRTLAHIMLQLSSLAKQSEDLFADLHYQCCKSFLRASHLDKRIEMVKMKIIQLNPIAEEVSLQDINLRKPFRSNDQKDQQVIDRDSRPSAITEVYNKAEPAPSLDKLNVYREDGRDSMKFYTDPNYFVELWCFEVSKDAEIQVKKQKQRIKQSVPEKIRTIRQPKNQHGTLDKRVNSLQRKSSKLDKSHITLPQAITSCSNPSALMLHSSQSLKRPQVYSEQGTLQRSKNELGYNTHVYSQNTLVKDGHASNLSSESMRSIMRPDYYHENGQTLPRMFAHGSHLSAQNINRHTQEISTPRSNNRAGNGEVYERTDTRHSHDITRNTNGFLDDKCKVDGKSQLPQTPHNELKNPTIPITSSLAPVYSPYGNSRLSDSETIEFPLPPPPSSYMAQESHNASQDSVPSPPPALTMSFINNSIGSGGAFPSPPSHLKNTQQNEDAYHFKNAYDYNATTSGKQSDGVLAALASLEAVEEMASLLASDAGRNTPDARSSTPSDRHPDAAHQTPHTKLRDTRSDLLSAIREGIQLRQVEERRQKNERQQQRKRSGHPLDVQSIMEAAFELRRKVMEQDDSEEEEEEPAGNWTDGD